MSDRPQPHEIAKLQHRVEGLVEPVRDLADRENEWPAAEYLKEAVRKLKAATELLRAAKERREREAGE